VKKRIVIAGFGDTGTLVATHLNKSYDIVGVSTKPALISGQELGARLTKLDAWKDNYFLEFDRINQLQGVNIIQGKVKQIEPHKNTVKISNLDDTTEILTYDLLVIASGTRNGFWRTANVLNINEIETDLGNQADRIAKAQTVSIIGGGPTGVSAASNVKEQYPEKNVHLYFRQHKILTNYHAKTQKFITQKLTYQGVHLHPGYHVKLPDFQPFPELEPGRLNFTSNHSPIEADCILWAVGQIEPNNDFIPAGMLNSDGFVKVDPQLRVEGYNNIFAIGDIAASDPHRSSARNAGFQLVAKNIHHYLSGQESRMKKFRAPQNRWGSVLGIQKEGMRIFTPKGSNVRVRPWAVQNILFPVFVHRLIYRGIKKRR